MDGNKAPSNTRNTSSAPDQVLLDKYTESFVSGSDTSVINNPFDEQSPFNVDNDPVYTNLNTWQNKQNKSD